MAEKARTLSRIHTFVNRVGWQGLGRDGFRSMRKEREIPGWKNTEIPAQIAGTAAGITEFVFPSSGPIFTRTIAEKLAGNSLNWNEHITTPALLSIPAILLDTVFLAEVYTRTRGLDSDWKTAVAMLSAKVLANLAQLTVQERAIAGIQYFTSVADVKTDE